MTEEEVGMIGGEKILNPPNGRKIFSKGEVNCSLFLSLYFFENRTLCVRAGTRIRPYELFFFAVSCNP